MSSPVTQEQKSRVRRRVTFDSQDETSTKSDALKHSNNTHTPPAEDPHPPNAPPPEPRVLSINELTEQQKKEQMERWNFDFENEVPLPGSWEWVAVARPRTTPDHKEVVKTLEMEKQGCCDDRNV